MQFKNPLWLLLPLLLLNVATVKSQSSLKMQSARILKISLDKGWEFREANKEKWYPATVPGSVHTDLLANKLIEDPFYRDNEQKQQWIGKTDWEYRTNFDVTKQTLDHKNLELVFSGLDTYADVYVNDKLLIKTDNMFRTWRVNCAPLLHLGANTLQIHFRSPINEILPLMAKMSYELPASNDQGEKTSPHTRKAPYQYGWDWGPRFVTSGIWKPVVLEAWDTAYISDLHIIQNKVSNEQATLTARVEVVAGDAATGQLIIEDSGHRLVVAKQQVTLKAGVNKFDLAFAVNNPALWWPNGLGAQPLYNFKARLVIAGKATDEKSARTGLRSLEVRQQKDAFGLSFAFIVNGVPVFAKGANWIPADSFPTRISKEKYHWLLKSAAEANMNMLRVWGGGIYESDEFYEMCDEMGILVWQDFMFACSMYPGTQEFLDSVRAEAIDNVKRLRDHPSIAIWSGNNEVEAAWQNWGWKKTLPASIWDDYLKIFDGVLKEVCADLDPSRLYWPSSPHGGLADDPNSLKSGDTHSWKVWHFAAPFTDYQKEFPRFMSEYGFQSFPQIETVASYTLPTEHDIQSPVMMAHQRHPRGNQLIKEYMLREYTTPKDFESFLYVSQVLQAEGIKVGAEHLRRIMPRNMGSLYWQLDDCWPVASWSSIDYFGRWKALQYYAKRFYAPVLLSPLAEQDKLNFYIVSDQVTPITGSVNVELRDLSGNKLTSFQRDVAVAPVQSQSYFSLPIKTLLAEHDTKSVMVYCEFVSSGKVIASNEYFFEPFKSLTLPAPTITSEVVRTKNGYKVILKTDKFARAVYLSTKVEGFFADNYFDLFPDKPVEIEFRTRLNVPVEEFRSQLQIRSLRDAFQ